MPKAARRALEFFPLGLFEKLDVLGIGTGPAALDVMDAKGVEFFGDAQLVHAPKN
jgi:hypothetical protein